jgi:dTDP-4-dehydrorhamnose 3,5-epimerase
MVSSQDLEISGVKLLTLQRHYDSRGWLNESWRDSWNEQLGTDIKFVQDMWSFSEKAYTLRGLHTVVGQQKFVIVLQGKVFDVIADARSESPTYGKYISVELSGENPTALIVPPGCYHGYVTLTDNTLLGYKVDQYHSPELDRGIHWNDPTFNIQWPLDGHTPIVSNKDSLLTNL